MSTVEGDEDVKIFNFTDILLLWEPITANQIVNVMKLIQGILISALIQKGDILT